MAKDEYIIYKTPAQQLCYSHDELICNCQIISHLVRMVKLGNHQVKLHGMLPIIRSATNEHSHTCYEAQIMLEGHAECRTNNRWQQVVPGQVTLHGPGMTHCWRGYGKPFLRLTFWFSISPAPEMKIHQEWPKQSQTISTLQSLFDDITLRSAGWNDRVAPHITVILSHLLSLAVWPEAILPELPSEVSLSYQLNRFLEDHLHEPILRRDIASYLGISERTLARYLIKQTGATLVEHVEQLRMNRAIQLLNNHKQSIKDISNVVGFSSPAYFNRRFMLHTGMTPGKYRQLNANNSVNS